MFLNLPHSCYLVSHFLYFIVNLCLLVIFSYNTSVNWRCKETIKRNKATEFPVFLCKLIVIFFFRNKSLFVKNKMNALCKHAIWNTVDPIVVHPNNLLWLWFLTALAFTSCVVGVHSGGDFGAPTGPAAPAGLKRIVSASRGAASGWYESSGGGFWMQKCHPAPRAVLKKPCKQWICVTNHVWKKIKADLSILSKY